MMTLLVNGLSWALGLGTLIALILFIILAIKWLWDEIFY